MSLFGKVKSIFTPQAREPTADGEQSGSVTAVRYYSAGYADVSADGAMKLSAVNRCIEILSDTMGKMPNYLIDTSSKERIAEHNVLKLLNVRPNEAMTPFTRRKLLESNRLIYGNAYEWIVRDPSSAKILELIPLQNHLVMPWRDTRGKIWYTVYHPYTGKPMTLSAYDICHYKAFSGNGIVGKSVLGRASEVLHSGQAMQTYETAYYENGGSPAGTLNTEADLSGNIEVPDGEGGTKSISKKDLMRNEWEKVHGGPSNAHRIAVLDHGLEYKPLSISHKDAQFVESKSVSVRDIARFFGVPLHLLFEGKESYASNEQNALEFASNTILPTVTQKEEEQSYKLLSISELSKNLELRIDMMALLRGDSTSRANWYKTMREVGAFSPNDILNAEDRPSIDGGDDHYASLNYVPLKDWAEISRSRAGGENNATSV